MNTTTTLIFAEMPKDYPGLVMNFMPKAIHDNVDYENTLEVIDTLVGHELTDEQELYLDTLSTLVDAYENEHYAMETHVSGRRTGKSCLRPLFLCCSDP